MSLTQSVGRVLSNTGIVSAVRGGWRRSAALGYRLLFQVYYRFLFGKSFMFAGRLVGKISRLEQCQARGDIGIAKEAWESQYVRGRWNRLEGVEQAPRYGVIAAYIQFFAPGGSLLDIGCGQGLLLRRLGAETCDHYVGIDLSEAAIAKAVAHPGIRSTFTCADAAAYVPQERFDGIVFNEVLYYFADPFEVIKRYEPWLQPGGVFITSLFSGSPRARAIARLLKKKYVRLDEVRIRSVSKAWIIGVFAPQRL